FPPAPGDLMVVAGAWYSLHGGAGWPLAFAAVTSGSLVGAAIDWRIGIWLAGRIERGQGTGRFFDVTTLRAVEERYRRWGAALLILNRFLPAVRGVFFVAAGVARLPLSK